MARKKAPPPENAIKVPLTDDERSWLDTFLTEWSERRGPRGQVKGSAMEYVRTDILDSYLNRFHSDRTADERERMGFWSTKSIYWYMRGANDRKMGAGAKGRKRIDVVNLWAKHTENSQVVDGLFDSYRQERNLPAGATIPVDDWRRITCDAFKNLPEETQSRYRDMAAGLKVENRKNTPLTGEARIDYAKSFVTELLRFIRKGEEKCGVIVVANVAYEVDNAGALKVTSVATNSAKKYKKTNSHADSLVGFGEWLRDTENKAVLRAKPLPAVYPDRQNENFLLIPQLSEPPVVSVGRDIVRGYISAMWQRLRGGGSVPWKAINTSYAKEEHRFVEPNRLPPGCPLIDPGHMDAEQVNTWIEWLSRPQLGIGDESTWFRFKRVLTANLDALPESSAAVGTTETRRGNARVFEVEYDGWVKTCQVGGQINYSAECLQYEEYLIAQRLARAAQSQPHWKGLPPRTPSNTEPAISETARDFILGLLVDILESDRQTVAELIDSLNKMYSLMPAENANGLWAEGSDSVIEKLGFPALLPLSIDALPDPMDYLTAFWIVVDYFRPPFEVDENATNGFVETWQHRLLKNGLLHHSESGTLLGGRNGTRWAVLAIVKYILNIGAVKGKLAPPIPEPEGLNSKRLSEGLWDLALEWCQAWTTEIQSTISILEETYDERASDPISSSLTIPTAESDDSSDIFGAPDGAGAIPNDTTPGPSRKLRPRPAYIPSFDPPPDDDESGSEHSRVSSDEDPDKSDTFQPSGDDDDQSDVGAGHVSAKGKETVRSKAAVEDICKKYLAKHVKSGSTIDRVSYEDEQQLHSDSELLRPNVAPDPLSDIPLSSHPFGPLTRPAPLDDWKGRISELREECKGIMTEARAALSAILESSQTAYRDEDEDEALQMATELDSVALPLLAVVCKQRIVWNRAKAAWPTMQYQLKTFEDLMQRSFQVLPILSACVRSAPPEVAPMLATLLKRLERVSFRVRFVYQELHDLGVLSMKYFDLLKAGWDSPSHVWDFSELQSTVELIFQWSEDTEAVLKWHQDAREKTWTMRKEDLDKSPLPLGTWYRFGNPGPQEESSEVSEWLRRDDPRSGGIGGRSSRSDEQMMHIDEQSPGADDARAQALLKDADGLEEHDSQRATTPDAPESAPASAGGKKKRDEGTKRKRSLGGDPAKANQGPKKKKLDQAAEKKRPSETATIGSSEGASRGGTTRSGRVPKPSMKVRG